MMRGALLGIAASADFAVALLVASRPFAGTRVAGLARSGAKNHDGFNQFVDTAAVLCE